MSVPDIRAQYGCGGTDTSCVGIQIDVTTARLDQDRRRWLFIPAADWPAVVRLGTERVGDAVTQAADELLRGFEETSHG